jgi:hypothetical protein
MRKIFLFTLTLAVVILFKSCDNTNTEIETNTGSIFGTIINKDTGAPIFNAGVELFKNNFLVTRTATGNNGQFEFLNLEESDNYVLSVVASGYRDVILAIQVRADRISQADMHLTRGSGATFEYVIIQNDGIMVQRHDISAGATWQNADRYCRNSRVGGFSNWRLPTQGELISLYNRRGVIRNFENTWYWSSTTWSPHWFALNFANRELQHISGSSSIRARCVRSLQ